MRLNRTRESEIAEILAANLGNPSRLFAFPCDELAVALLHPGTTANPSGLFAVSCCGGPVLVPVRIFITDFAFFFAAITADAARCCSANDNLIKCLVRRCFTQWNMERVKPERPNSSYSQLEKQESAPSFPTAMITSHVSCEYLSRFKSSINSTNRPPFATGGQAQVRCPFIAALSVSKPVRTRSIVSISHQLSLCNTAGGSPDHE